MHGIGCKSDDHVNGFWTYTRYFQMVEGTLNFLLRVQFQTSAQAASYQMQNICFKTLRFYLAVSSFAELR